MNEVCKTNILKMLKVDSLGIPFRQLYSSILYVLRLGFVTVHLQIPLQKRIICSEAEVI